MVGTNKATVGTEAVAIRPSRVGIQGRWNVEVFGQARFGRVKQRKKLKNERKRFFSEQRLGWFDWWGASYHADCCGVRLEGSVDLRRIEWLPVFGGNCWHFKYGLFAWIHRSSLVILSNVPRKSSWVARNSSEFPAPSTVC